MPATYQTLVTNYGQAALASAISGGTTVQLATLVVGDGGGSATTPSASQTALVNQVYSVALNSVSVDSSNPNYIVAEAVIPSSVGGWTIREAGLKDASGNLFAVANYADTVKPVVSSGTAADLVIRFIFQVSNTAAVTLLIDPAVVMASQSWVLSQAYVKRDGSVAMTGPLVLSGAPTLNLHAATKSYVDGLIATCQAALGFTPVNKAGDTMTGPLVLSGAPTLNLHAATKSYVDGLIATCQAALGFTPVNKAGDTMTGFLTLSGMPTATMHAAPKQYVDNAVTSAVPAGTVIYVAMASAPSGYLKANGAAVSRTTYAVLFAAIGTTFGVGDGSTTFNLPDLRSEFIRGLDDGRGVDSGRALGSLQSEMVGPHTHVVTSPGTRSGSNNQNPGGVLLGSSGDVGNYGAVSITSNSNSGTENRPRNIALLAVIKF
jgi:phage-related tail fiber protein